MSSLEELKKKRFQFLHKLWELTGGNQSKMVRIGQVAEPLGFDDKTAEAIVQYLEGEELVEATTSGLVAPSYFDVGLYIKHKGIKEVEAALTTPQSPTEHFPANVTNYISIGSMIDSSISQASPGSYQTISINENSKQELKEIVLALKEVLQQALLKQEQKEEMESEIQTLESQIRSPKPKVIIIRESLSSAKRILESAGGPAGAAAPLTTRISAWLSGDG